VAWGIPYPGFSGVVSATPGMRTGLGYPLWVLYFTGYTPYLIKEWFTTSRIQYTDKIPPFTDNAAAPANFVFQNF